MIFIVIGRSLSKRGYLNGLAYMKGFGRVEGIDWIFENCLRTILEMWYFVAC